nr:CPCC family cysteine-rich protein [Flavobacterium sp. ASV13]
MDREEAKKAIAACELKSLSDQDKLEILENNYWFFGDKEGIVNAIENGCYPKISYSFIELINNTPNPILNEESEVLLLDYLKRELSFVSNSYLELRLNSAGLNFDDKVTGEVEKAGLCPCCEYYSIEYGEDGLWDICSVCFWENGGEGPNHMTLKEAKLNFEKFGAINTTSLDFIDKEGKMKYNKKA